MTPTTSAPRYSLLTRLILLGYGLAKNSGLLEMRLAKRLFLQFYFLYKKYLEDPFESFNKKYPELFLEGLVLDIGANCGYTALLFAKTSCMKVYAFEPDPDNVSMLHDLINRKKLNNRVAIVAAAVGATDGSIQLWRNLTHHADHRIATDSFKKENLDRLATSVEVPLISIDSYLKIHDPTLPVSFIKIDVQGFEPPVCEGLVETLSRFPNLSLALEFCPNQIEELGFSSSSLLEFFTSRGFSWYLIERSGDIIPYNKNKVDLLLEQRGYVDLLATKRKLLQ